MQEPLLPPFTEAGPLPPGDYALTMDQLAESMLVIGPGSEYPTWDAAWRRHLVNQLGILVEQLWQVGITEIFADGSFVEDRDRPGAIDGYFVCDWQDLAFGRLQSRLNDLDPFGVWTWEEQARRLDPVSGRWKLPMWHRYRVELFPHVVGLPDSIPNDAINAQDFPTFFRTTRSGEPRGLVRIVQ